MIKDRLQHFIDNCDKSFAKNLVIDALKEIEQLEASYMNQEVTIEKLQARVIRLEKEIENLNSIRR